MNTENKVFIVDEVMEQVIRIARKYDVGKLILFGSRARGDHHDKSDYDIAVIGIGSDQYKKAVFSLEIEDLKTLKKIDVVFVDDKTDGKLLSNIIKEGVVLYE